MNLSVLRRHPKVTALALFAALLLYALWPLTYSADAIDARLVDEETNEPIKGAIVLAHWELVGGLEGGHVQGQMMVMETETDANGYFHFPAWGPKLIPLSMQLADLGFRDPAIIIFKPGYQIGGELSNDKTSKQLLKKGPSRRVSQWDGKTITVRRADRHSKTYRDGLGWLSDNLSRIGDYPPDPCAWRKMPRMIMATSAEVEQLGKDFLLGSPYDHYVGNEEHIIEIGCGSPTQFLEGYKK